MQTHAHNHFKRDTRFVAEISAMLDIRNCLKLEHKEHAYKAASRIAGEHPGVRILQYHEKLAQAQTPQHNRPHY